jgi:hypothetical protein
MDIHSSFNLVEGIFWIILSLVVLVWSFKVDPVFKKIYIAASILLLAFGCSDFVEIRTGAWWRPWWLLVWKGGCLTGFAFLSAWYYLLKKRNAEAKD